MAITITRLSRSSWFKITWGSTIVHLDPGYGGFLENVGLPMKELEPDADIILISHGHQDHVREEVLNRIISPATTIVCPPETAIAPKFKVTLAHPGQTMDLEGISVEIIDAYNTPSGHSTRKYHPKGFGVGYIITIGGLRLYHGGDTDVIDEMSRASGVDVAFLPVGATYTMDLGEAIDALAIIKPKLFIPMHEFDLANEAIKTTLDKQCPCPYRLMRVGDAISFPMGD
ncbi:MAG: MBL fold metallo-hydrolase [Bacilli bacterium]|jgi:L-ascorbate metabolism protein UlaG (beta-lactamase superfamily)